VVFKIERCVSSLLGLIALLTLQLVYKTSLLGCCGSFCVLLQYSITIHLALSSLLLPPPFGHPRCFRPHSLLAPRMRDKSKHLDKNLRDSGVAPVIAEFQTRGACKYRQQVMVGGPDMPLLNCARGYFVESALASGKAWRYCL
jgi:hypothetical protein